MYIFGFHRTSIACFACPNGTLMPKHQTCTSFVSMRGHTYGKCFCSISRRLFPALVVIITMRNDNGTWQIVGCRVWIWFRLTHHAYTTSCTPAIKDRAANHMPELCWLICIGYCVRMSCLFHLKRTGSYLLLAHFYDSCAICCNGRDKNNSHNSSELL